MERENALQRLWRRIAHPEPVKTPPRQIRINDAEWATTAWFKPNVIFTAKYNFITFLPKFLLEQFMRLANFYFLVISIIQMSSETLAPTGQYYTFGPLVAILALTAGKEILEDYRRHRQDAETNNRRVLVHRPAFGNEFREIAWKEVQVGDIVQVRNDEPFPSDLLLLSSSEPEALCYVETSQLDGETNLKIRQGLSYTATLQSEEAICGLRGTFDCEGPNNSLYTFEGTLTLPDNTTLPVGPNQILLRGSRLKNTRFVFGLSIYTGHESKLLMNARATPIKKSRLEKMVNNQITAIFGLLFVMALTCTIGFIIWNNVNIWDNDGDGIGFWYLSIPADGGSALENFTQFIVFIILFNTIVPISLYVSIEFVKYFQAIFINSDIDMYYAEADSPALARTSNLNEELGQIDFIFTDKTGTLTRNQMQFRKCSIAGISYGLGYTDAYRSMMSRAGTQLPPDPPELAKVATDDFCFYDPSLIENLTMNRHPTSPFIREFLVMLAVCHTVIPERDKHDPRKTVYQAASPDEAALVNAAKEFGFYFHARNPQSVRIMALDKPLTYEVLAVLEFNSTRKRMSVICRTPEGKVMLYCKGADTMIFERLDRNFSEFQRATEEHLQRFAAEGLRTLCFAIREIPEEEYKAWSVKFQEASTTLTDRGKKIDECAEEIERDLFLLGATAIEDRLQLGVPETIQNLLDAGIRVWMLTGDKKETAINIGYCSQLIREDMQVQQCEHDDAADIARWAKDTLQAHRADPKPMALVIEGGTLTRAFADPVSKAAVIDLALACSSCICCRVSPLQKAEVVHAVRKNLKCRTLAIGDGANDVTMIQTADVGVGIAGLEGLQAARSADYAIGQFRFLRKLLLVHGALSYRRLSKLILYSFYKTLTLYLVSFYFSFDNGFSGQIPWDKVSNALWNVIFTFFPVIVLGLFDQDVTADRLLAHPELYKSGQRNDFFNLRVFAGWFLNSIYHSILIYLSVNWLIFNNTVFPNGLDQDLYVRGTMLFATVLLVVTGKMCYITSYWTVWNHVFIWCSLLVYYLLLIIAGASHITFYEDARVLYGVFINMLKSAQFWLATVVLAIGLLLRDYTWKFFKRQYFPQDYHIIQEQLLLERKEVIVRDIEARKSEEQTIALQDTTTAAATVRDEAKDHLKPPAAIGPADHRYSRESGYAFSQAERDDSKMGVTQTQLVHIYDTDKDRADLPN